MTPSPHPPPPSKQAIDAAFDDLIGQTNVNPKTVITFAKLAAQHELTQATKDGLLAYAVTTSAMSTREDKRNVDDTLREQLRGLASTMLGLGAEPNFRPTQSTTHGIKRSTARSLLDIAHDAEDQKMRELLRKAGAHSGTVLDARSSAPAARVSPKSRDMLRGFRQEDRDEGHSR